LSFLKGNRFFYGWVVVVAFLLIGTTLFGIRLTFGVFFKSIESQFSLTRTFTSAILSANLILGGACAILGGWALDRFGPKIILFLMAIFTVLSLFLTGQTTAPWQLFFTYSVLLALGTGPAYVAVMSTVSRWFDKKRGLALGIASSGNGLGTMVMAILAAYLIANFDWRTAYMVIGILALAVVMPLSQLLKRDPREAGTLPDGVKAAATNSPNDVAPSSTISLTLPQALRTRSFWLVLFLFILFASSFYLVLTHVVPHATDKGIDPVKAASILSLMGAANIAGRVLMGTISDRIGRKFTTVICTLLQAGTLLWLMWSQSLWMFYLYALVYGFAFGGSEPILAALIGDTFGVGKLGAILGVLDAAWGVGAAIGPIIGGYVFDVTDGYFVAFLYGALAMTVVSLLIILIRRETS